MSSQPNPPIPPRQSTTPDGQCLSTQARERRGSGNRHGGAWKVAYADFVTAMMALFIVLWMMNSTQRVKASITGYFRDPRGYTERLGAGPAAAAEGLPVDKHNVSDLQGQIEQALQSMPDFSRIRNNVQFSMTGEGLRIDLLETEQGLFFVSGNATPTSEGEHLLQLLAGQISAMPNRLVIEGHTDSRPFRNAAPESGYGNWDLATDRANAARRLLHSYGVRPEQVVEVRGYADQKLLDADHPDSARNRRFSLVVKFE